MEELEKIEHPKPGADFIYQTFNDYAASHPYLDTENIRPKSIAREIYETYSSFEDYIKTYQLEKSEAILLRHLSEVYKVLSQTVSSRSQNGRTRSSGRTPRNPRPPNRLLPPRRVGRPQRRRPPSQCHCHRRSPQKRTTQKAQSPPIDLDLPQSDRRTPLPGCRRKIDSPCPRNRSWTMPHQLEDLFHRLLRRASATSVSTPKPATANTSAIQRRNAFSQSLLDHDSQPTSHCSNLTFAGLTNYHLHRIERTLASERILSCSLSIPNIPNRTNLELKRFF